MRSKGQLTFQSYDNTKWSQKTEASSTAASRDLSSFYPNVTTLRSGLCCRRSVCLSVCRL